MDESLKAVLQQTPASFKDARLSLESALASGELGAELAHTVAYAVALSVGAERLATELKSGLPPARAEQAEVAAAVMGMTNVYYSFVDTVSIPGLKELPPQLRMVSYGQQAQKDPIGFEAAALAVSMVAKCKPCVVSHTEGLRKHSWRPEQFRDLARIAAATHALGKAV